MALVLKDEKFEPRVLTTEEVAKLELKGSFQPPIVNEEGLVFMHFIDSEGKLWQSTEPGVWDRLKGPTEGDLAKVTIHE